MKVTDYQQMGRDEQRRRVDQAELVERIAQGIQEDGVIGVMPGLQLRRASSTTELGHGVTRPSVCVIAQGSKEILLGDKHYRYDPAHYLIATAALPIASRITEASPQKPYLAILLDLDPAVVSSVIAETGHSVPRNGYAVTAIDVSLLDTGLLDAMVRLVSLLDSSTDARFLVPLVTREIVYRLLMGEQGGRLRHLAVLDGNTHLVVGAIERLRKEFDQPLHIEEMAHDLGMSVSGFYHHFKAVTAMSPLQFQKQLRLQEARRLMLGEYLDATTAGSRVGYDDASHFSREYKRLFGAPPVRDVEQLQKATGRATDFGVN